MKIHVHPSLCDGHRECRRVGGEFFLLDGDGHLELRKVQVPPELEFSVVLAAETCPTDAITVIKEDGDHFR
jgi:ferredoxin